MDLRRILGLSVGVALAVTGCVSAPDSGSVTHVDAAGPPDGDPLFFDPAGPVDGAQPDEIVRGFYGAMQAFPLTTEDAKEFLTAGARRDWEPTDRTVVFESDIELRRPATNVVESRIDPVAVLDEDGSYRPEPPNAAVHVNRLVLRRERGEWRIANPPNAIYVDSYFFSRYYEPFSLYFIGPSGHAMVPEPIYLPIGEQPATALVEGVLAGPPSSWRGQLGTAVPPLTEPEVSVPITAEDVAEVRLTGPILDLTGEQQRLLSAQLVWTLAQLPGLDGVQILVDGVPLVVPGVPAVQDIEQSSSLDPSTVTTRGQMFALQSGRLVQVVGRNADPPKGSMWSARQGIRSFDVDLQLGQVAAVSTDGTRLLSGPLFKSAGRIPRTLYAGGSDLGTPVDTPGQEWLVVDRLPDGSSRLLIAGEEGTQVAQMGGLGRQRVESLSLSPDGMRFAALARPVSRQDREPARIVIGRVQRDRDGERVVGLFDPRELVVAGETVDGIRSVAWYDAETLAVLGRTDDATGPEAYTVRIDGSDLTSEWFLPDMDQEPTRLLTSVGADGRAYLTDRSGGIWVESGGQWVRVEGSGFAALNFAG